MTRRRVGITVDRELLLRARTAKPGWTDGALVDHALGALVARRLADEIDAAYSTYDDHPLDETDQWGDLASFSEAATPEIGPRSGRRIRPWSWRRSFL